MDLLAIIKEVSNIQEFFNKGLAKLNSPRALLTLVNNLDPE